MSKNTYYPELYLPRNGELGQFSGGLNIQINGGSLTINMHQNTPETHLVGVPAPTTPGPSVPMIIATPAPATPAAHSVPMIIDTPAPATPAAHSAPGSLMDISSTPLIAQGTPMVIVTPPQHQLNFLNEENYHLDGGSSSGSRKKRRLGDSSEDDNTTEEESYSVDGSSSSGSRKRGREGDNSFDGNDDSFMSFFGKPSSSDDDSDASSI